MSKPKNCRTCNFKSNKEGECWFVHDENDCPLIDIVQCKDCKWGDMGIDEGGKPFWKCIGIHYGGTKPTDFCSYGERRADGDI